MKWLVAGTTVLVMLLFVSGADSQDTRLAREVWDLGHVVLFAALSTLAVNLSRLRSWSPWRLLMLCAVAAPLLGLAIEWLQLMVGRDFEYLDVLADTVGAFCGLALHFSRQSAISRYARTAWGIGLVLLLAFALRLITQVLVDYYYMQQAFPVLADFETPFELARWDTHLAQLQTSHEQVRYGEKSLRVTYLAGKYPDITLFDLPGDWRDFRSVRFSVFSTLNNPIQMELKIYDALQISGGYEYADRFNRELMIHPGWNDIEVRMDDVWQAPQGRHMDLQNMAGVSLFIQQLKQPAVFYVDGLRLSSK